MKNLITQTSMDMIQNHNVRLIQYFQNLASRDEGECNNYELCMKRSMPDIMEFLFRFSGVDASLLANSTACLFELRPQKGGASLEELSPASEVSGIIREHVHFCNSMALCYNSIMELNNDTFLFSDQRSSGHDHLRRYLKLVLGDAFVEAFWDRLFFGRLEIGAESVMFFPRFNASAVCKEERFSFQTKFNLLTSLLSKHTKDQEVLAV